MTAERELAGFALPFTAGAALYCVFSPLFPAGTTLSAGVLLTIILSGAAALLHPSHKRLSTSTIWTIIIGLATCCGLLCRLTDDWTSICGTGAQGYIESWINRQTEYLRNCIRSIPFNDYQTNTLINALITGDRSELSRDTTEIFRASGASHILALSGMHLGIIYGLLKGISSPMGNSPKIKTLKRAGILTACSIYTATAGAGASLVRALIFIFIAETALSRGRFKSTGSLLLSSVIIQLTIFPDAISDIGFQLSYAAMPGIAYIYPHLQKLWPQANKNEGGISKGLRWLWSTAALSIACQLTTAPLAYIYFGTFPKYFILTNLISSPLVLIIIPYSIIVTALTSIGACPAILAEYLEKLVNILIDSLSIIASF
jgi:ComEC/Rec2-related protein